ncbi:sigma 54-interacting transcriptional regulator [Paludibaculum fermentans]|uniref:sigma 54-interacting transcriptional regulator n=1 Tax=Paludibaculum fermentans TaxID=1473598 RepID=UPI003EBB70F2
MAHNRENDMIAAQGEGLAGAQNDRGALEAIINLMPSIAWRAQPDGSTEFVNERFYEYTGLTAEQARGWGWHVALHPDELPRVMEYYREHLRSGEPGEMEMRMRRFDGEYRWFLVRGVPNRDEQGELINWYGNSTDIDDWKRAEHKSRQREAELEQIVDTIAQLVLVLNPDGSAIRANRFMLDYTGLSLEDVMAPTFRSLVFHPDDVERVETERQGALLQSAPFQLEQRIRQSSGQYRWFLIRYSPLLNEQGQPVRWYAAGLDVEARRQAEDRTQNENVALREEIIRSSMFEEIIGSSAALRSALKKVEKVAPSDSTVLILGETGTGKELIARSIHRLSNRAERAFIRVNCAAIPAPLLASELFGHEKGAFTGAVQRRLGRFEAAEGGTIFLDEIGDLPAETQIALLRVLQEREFERVGSNQPVSVNVRVIAATHRDLKAEVAAGRFRQDLFYRLDVFPIQVPSLRERADDIPLLLEYLIGRYGKRAGKRFQSIPRQTLELIQAYHWPGNIRELQNVVERAVLLCDSEVFVVEESWLRRDAPVAPAPSIALGSSLEDREREMIEGALTACDGRVAGPRGAAVMLGMPRQTLDSRIARLQIDKHRFKAR